MRRSRLLPVLAILTAMTATMTTAMTNAAAAQTPVLLHAAGSLRGALTDVSRAFEAATGLAVSAKYGPSGILKDEIAGGAKAEVFASANMEHPQALARAGQGGPVVLFARNRMCALARPGLAVTTDDVLDSMQDDGIRLATSTPKADPSGDYAWEVFRKAEQVTPGAFARLTAKALQLTGGPASPAPPPGRSIYGALVAEGRADIFLTYCTNSVAARKENAGQQVIALPDALAVGADYGLTVIEGASPSAYRLAMFILSTEGQRILASHGFAAPGLVER